jgi:hypothetical protein
MFNAPAAVTELPSPYGEEIYFVQPERLEANVASTSAGTPTGKWADIIVATADNTGAPYRVFVRAKSSAQVELLKLLESWINEYGDSVDPDFDQQVQELERNRLRFGQP